MAFIHIDISWSRQYWTLRTCHLLSALTPIRAWFSRVKFYTQEIVFFRQDLLYRMRRSCLIPPTAEETSDPFEHLVATITHQSHLCPLPLTVQPIIWNYDHCLRLYPTPDMIVLADKSEQKAFKYTGITCFNPGSFANDSTFAAYRPCTKEVELSALES